jgi:tripartite ATP-independent transporter DctP family solute receptor
MLLQDMQKPAPKKETTMTMTRRTALQGAATAAVLGLPTLRLARAAEFAFKCATDLPLTHPASQRLQAACNRISAETRGRVDIQVFPANQLGSDTDALSQVRSGALELLLLPGLIISTLVPAASMNCVAFAFGDYPSVWKAMDGDLGSYIRKQIAKAGLVPMQKVWDNGFRQITSSVKQVTGPESLEGFKLRVPASPLWTSAFKALGASPVTINFNEVYTALQTRVADGQENPLAVIETTKLYEVQRYCALTNHIWDGFWFVANARVWDALPADLRAIVSRAMDDAAIAERADLEALNLKVRDQLTARGMVFTTPSLPAFRGRLSKAGFYKEWAGKYGDEAWGVLESSVGKLI